MNKTELVFVPMPGLGHVASSVELANQLLSRDDRLSVTILVTKSPFSSQSSVESATSTTFRSLNAHESIRFVNVLTPEQLPPQQLLSQSLEIYIGDYMASHKSIIKDIITERFEKASVKLSGLILDLFCSAMVELAEELHVPSYVFYTSGAATLGFILFLHSHGLRGGEVFDASGTVVDVPSFANPVPSRVLPAFALSEARGFGEFVKRGGEFKRVKGVIVNTVLELESHAISSFAEGATTNPVVYTVGPLLDLDGRAHRRPDRAQEDHEIMRWLDDQPEKSVVFLCFGSLGAFRAPQLRQIAVGLERSGKRFLWSVSKASAEEKHSSSPPEHHCDDEDEEEFLPKGFLERTEGRGMLCGWAPQVAVLAHPAVGGFVSHCGWNSILESLWFGVPMATWPLYAEQQLNAFQLVRDLGLAVEVSVDYRMDGREVVTAEEVERAVRCLMDSDGAVRKKVEEASEKCRMAVVDGGSSFESLGCFIDDVIANAA